MPTSIFIHHLFWHRCLLSTRVSPAATSCTPVDALDLHHGSTAIVQHPLIPLFATPFMTAYSGGETHFSPPTHYPRRILQLMCIPAHRRRHTSGCSIFLLYTPFLHFPLHCCLYLYVVHLGRSSALPERAGADIRLSVARLWFPCSPLSCNRNVRYSTPPAVFRAK